MAAQGWRRRMVPGVWQAVGGLALRHLNVSSCMLGPDGATSLACALPHCALLEELVCSHNHVRADGAAAIASALPLCVALTRLNDLAIPAPIYAGRGSEKSPLESDAIVNVRGN